ncbi:MAG: YgiT-type zinc finger protein [Candidatus Competibacteraceae bacterium]|nr:YgiT-type zinc finger protein [Candidatus Competibacteraceae bacterium]
MMPFTQCPVCSGELAEKQVEKLLRGGCHTAMICVPAEVCLHCGDACILRISSGVFEQIRTKLQRQEVSEFQPLGQSFRVAESGLTYDHA